MSSSDRLEKNLLALSLLSRCLPQDEPQISSYSCRLCWLASPEDTAFAATFPAMTPALMELIMPPPVRGSDWWAASPTSIIPSEVMLFIVAEVGIPPDTISRTLASGILLSRKLSRRRSGRPGLDRDPCSPIPTLARPLPLGKIQMYPPGARLLPKKKSQQSESSSESETRNWAQTIISSAESLLSIPAHCAVLDSTPSAPMTRRASILAGSPRQKTDT